MKTKMYQIGLLILIGMYSSCRKDNYKAPGSHLSGRIQYNGENIQVEYEKVPFDLYQFGFGKTGPIRQFFSQNGELSCLLFDGQYKLTIPAGKIPFKWKQTSTGKPDTLTIDLQGSMAVDINVTPFYMIREPKLAVEANKVTGAFKLEKIITDASAKDIDAVRIFINKTLFVSPTNNLAFTELKGTDITNPDAINLSVTIPDLTPRQNYLYARIGLKVAGIQEWIFSPIHKLTF